MKTLISWNVNGIRAAIGHGMWDWFLKEKPDFFLIQEIKAMPEQLEPHIVEPKGYHAYFHPAEKKGYSGVAAFVKKEPLTVRILGVEEFDREGRVQVLEYEDFIVINIISAEKLSYLL